MTDVLMLLAYEDEQFYSKVIEKEKLPIDIEVPFLHEGGCVLEIYSIGGEQK